MEERWKCVEVHGRAVGMHEEVMKSEVTSSEKSVEYHRGEDVRDVRGGREPGASRHRVVGIIRD